MKQLLLEISPPPSAAFDNFVIGSNREVVESLQSLASGALAERVVYVWGAAGTGKSHLLAAVCAATVRPHCVVGEEIPAATDDVTLIIVDDVARLADAQQSKLFNLINNLGPSTLLIAGPCAPRDLALRRDLATRLGHGLIFQLRALTDAEKHAALNSHARKRGFQLSDEVLRYLLRHERRDMPSLIAVLDALDRHSLETGRPITVPLLKEALHAR